MSVLRATVFIQQTESNWCKIKEQVMVQLCLQKENLVDGISLVLNAPSSSSFTVPKRVRNLWLGSVKVVKYEIKSELELRFKFNDLSKGFMGCAVMFESEKDFATFHESLISSGVKSIMKSQSPPPIIKASKPKEKPATKKRGASDCISGAPDEEGGQKSKQKVEVTLPKPCQEDDSEPDTSPEIFGIQEDNKSTPMMKLSGVQAFVNANSNMDIINMHDPEVRQYIQSLLADANFHKAIDEVEQLI